MNRNNVHFLEAVRIYYNTHKDLVIYCLNGRQYNVSRLLFGILVIPELQKEILNNEDSYIILEIEKEQIEEFYYNAYFSEGLIEEKIARQMPFVDWCKFKTKLFTKTSPEVKTNVLTPSTVKNEIKTNSASDVSKTKVTVANVKSTSKSNTYPCLICGKILSDKKNLKKHADVVHFNIRKHSCSECGKRFITRRDLQTHFQSIHKQQKFICDQCGQALSTRQGLRQHSLIHLEGSKNISCSRCDKKFRHLSTYRKHITRVHEKPEKISCNHCGKLYNHGEGLKRHLRKYHLEAPSFSCDLCPQSFVFNYDLNKHKKRTH